MLKKLFGKILVFVLIVSACTVKSPVPSDVPVSYSEVFLADPGVAKLVPVKPGIGAYYQFGVQFDSALPLHDAGRVTIISVMDDELNVRLPFAADWSVNAFDQVAKAGANVSAFNPEVTVVGYVYYPERNVLYPAYLKDSMGSWWMDVGQQDLIRSGMLEPSQISYGTKNVSGYFTLVPPADAAYVGNPTAVFWTTSTEAIAVPEGILPVTAVKDYYGNSLRNIVSILDDNSEMDVIVSVATERDVEPLLAVLQNDEGFMNLSSGLRWRGAGRVYVADADELRVFRPLATPRDMLILEQTVSEARLPAGITRAGVSQVTDPTGNRIYQLILANPTAEEIRAYSIQAKYLRLSEFSAYTLKSGLVVDMPYGTSFRMARFTYGWVGAENQLAELQGILLLLQEQGVVVPGPYIERIHVLPNGQVMVNPMGAIPVDPAHPVDIRTSLAFEWSDFVDRYGSEISLIDESMFGLQIGGTHREIPAPKLHPYGVTAPELLTREVSLPVNLTEESLSHVLVEAELPVERSALKLLLPRLASYAGKAIVIGLVAWDIYGWYVIVDELGNIVFQWGPNVQVPSVSIAPSADPNVLAAIEVWYQMTGGTAVDQLKAGAPWLMLASDESGQDFLPDLYDLWDEAQTQLQLGEAPCGYVYLSAAPVSTIPSKTAAVAVPYCARGSVNNPESVTLYNIEAQTSATFMFSTSGWMLTEGSMESLTVRLDTGDFGGIACFEYVSIDASYRLHFVPRCTYAVK